jgi:sulfatase modifying factor 1
MNRLRRLVTCGAVALALVNAGLTTACADTLNWIAVGHAGNAPDTTGVGAVNDPYRIMRFEFTNAQYTAFLNAVDPSGSNPNSIWNSSMGSDARGGISRNAGAPPGSRYAVRPSMGDKPVNFVSWWDAARVANWLHNGAQTYGTTDASPLAPQNTGAYSVGTATSGNAVARNTGALYWIPTENEWHKAAFHNPTLNGGVGGYRLFGNGFDTMPTTVTANATGVGTVGGTGNFANYNRGADWNGQDGNVTTVGTNGGTSHYGAYDMSGNVWEWNDLMGTAGSSRGVRGGDWFFTASALSSADRSTSFPADEDRGIGFRLARPPFTVDWITVGHAGNAPDTTGVGVVNDPYQIMRFEFTNSQYTAFLNAVDPAGSNPNSIWSSSMGSDARGGISRDPSAPPGGRYAVRPNMGDKPVNFVSWWDAARVANWLHNGAQTYGTTDASAAAPQNTGAYSVGTATSGNAVARNAGAIYRIPTENEWHKAAFYDPTLNGGAGGYRLFGNGFDTTPTAVTANGTGAGTVGGTGNFANYNRGADWNSQDGNVTTVGTNGGASHYGAFDMSGNVWEWNDLMGTAGSSRGVRGGDWFFNASALSSSDRSTSFPADEDRGIGFRLAGPVAVPEPSTWVMGAGGLACAAWRALRRRRTP